jgi:hypothetical protein
MDLGDLLWFFGLASVIVGIATCAVVEKNGAWNAYSSCLIHHTPDQCGELKPR